MSEQSPVVEIYKGIKIRKCNKVKFTFSAAAYKHLLLESERTDMPITKVLIHSSKPCDRCLLIDVIAFNKEGQEFKIKRGILSRHIPEDNGRSIIKQANEISNRTSQENI